MKDVPTPYVYSVEMWYENRGWVKEIRFYAKEKRMSDFDLRSVPGKRRNAQFIGIL